jgi:predicted AAA+ superfamily ATPase
MNSTIYRRDLSVPNHSFFLFGPRGTGKTTWLRQKLAGAQWFDLIKNVELLRLMQEPELFRVTVENNDPGTWIVIDEIQKLPQLLNDVHDIISRRGKDYLFAISGSSARKLKRLETNLLAGRVIKRDFFPLTASEISNIFDLDNVLTFGMLPEVVTNSEYSIDILEAYVGTYIQQEIQQEAMVKNLASFARFLKIASNLNGTIINVSNIARDCAVTRPTVERYFDILESTHIGFKLSAWKPGFKVKETSHPKFFFFDTGVVRALTGRLREPIDSAERGYLLETYLLHELRAYMNVANCGGELSYWNTSGGKEIDVIWSRGNRKIGFEIKSSSRWRRSFGKTVDESVQAGMLTKGYCIYAGMESLQYGSVQVLPVNRFLSELSAGKILM